MYQRKTNQDLIRDYVRLDNNTSAHTMEDECRRMNACSEMFSELMVRNIPNLDALIAAENKKYWRNQELEDA